MERKIIHFPGTGFKSVNSQFIQHINRFRRKWRAEILDSFFLAISDYLDMLLGRKPNFLQNVLKVPRPHLYARNHFYFGKMHLKLDDVSS